MCAQNRCGLNVNHSTTNFFPQIAKITNFTKILPLENTSCTVCAYTQSIYANTHSCLNFMCCTIDATRILKTALKDGYIPHKDDLFLIHGPGGVGKSSLISMFLGKQRDLVRVSTAVAEESIHLCPIRDVSTSTFTDQWEVVNIDRQARMVAHTSHHLLTKKVHKSITT